MAAGPAHDEKTTMEVAGGRPSTGVRLYLFPGPVAMIMSAILGANLHVRAAIAGVLAGTFLVNRTIRRRGTPSHGGRRPSWANNRYGRPSGLWREARR